MPGRKTCSNALTGLHALIQEPISLILLALKPTASGYAGGWSLRCEINSSCKSFSCFFFSSSLLQDSILIVEVPSIFFGNTSPLRCVSTVSGVPLVFVVEQRPCSGLGINKDWPIRSWHLARSERNSPSPSSFFSRF
jgi:hypothetical protein